MASLLVEDDMEWERALTECRWALTESKCVQSYFHLILSHAELLDSLDGISFEPTYQRIYNITIRGHGVKVYDVLLEELALSMRG